MVLMSKSPNTCPHGEQAHDASTHNHVVDDLDVLALCRSLTVCLWVRSVLHISPSASSASTSSESPMLSMSWTLPRTVASAHVEPLFCLACFGCSSVCANEHEDAHRVCVERAPCKDKMRKLNATQCGHVCHHLPCEPNGMV